MLPDDHDTQFADIFFTPVVAGYHLTKTDHIAFSVQIYAPTGAYSTSRACKRGAEHVDVHADGRLYEAVPEREYRVVAELRREFLYPNSDTHYHNAPVSVLDVMALKRFGSGWGVGVVGGYIQQLGA